MRFSMANYFEINYINLSGRFLLSFGNGAVTSDGSGGLIVRSSVTTGVLSFFEIIINFSTKNIVRIYEKKRVQNVKF